MEQVVAVVGELRCQTQTPAQRVKGHLGALVKKGQATREGDAYTLVK